MKFATLLTPSNVYITPFSNITQPSSLLCPPSMGRGRGTYCFSADPVGVSVATCLHSISLLNGQILAKLTQLYHWEGEKCLLDFGDLDPIFKVTGRLRSLKNGA